MINYKSATSRVSDIGKEIYIKKSLELKLLKLCKSSKFETYKV